MEKIKIVMVAPDFPVGEKINGGTEGVAYYLCDALSRNKEIDLSIIHPFSNVGNSHTSNFRGLDVYNLNTNKSASFLDPLYFHQINKKISQLSPDIVHFQEFALWSTWCKFPNIVTIHGIAERDALFKGSLLTSRLKSLVLWMIEGTTRKKIPNVISISPYVREFLGDPKKQNVWDIPNPVADVFFEIKHRRVPHRIFSASLMTPRKNVKSLIYAFANIAKYEPQAELRLAGSGQNNVYGIECRRLVEKLDLTDRVKFLGLLSLEEVIRELTLAACFALCSYQETTPLSIAEAMAVGVPIVASNVGGVSSMFEDGVSGKLVNPKDISNITHGLESVLFTNSDFGEAAKKIAETNYRSSTVAQKTVSAYQEIYRYQNEK